MNSRSHYLCRDGCGHYLLLELNELDTPTAEDNSPRLADSAASAAIVTVIAADAALWCAYYTCCHGFQLHLYWLRVVGLFNLTPNLIVIYMIGVLCWTDCLVWTSLWAKGPTCQTLWWNFAKWYAIRYDSCFPFHSQHFLFVYHRHNPWDWTQQLDQTFVLWP